MQHNCLLSTNPYPAKFFYTKNTVQFKKRNFNTGPGVANPGSEDPSFNQLEIKNLIFKQAQIRNLNFHKSNPKCSNPKSRFQRAQIPSPNFKWFQNPKSKF